jgi:hypothetical protein
MSADELRQARACLLRVAEPPAPAVIAFVAERGHLAFPEQLASAPGAVIARREPIRMSAVGKRMTELSAPAMGAFVAERGLSALRERVAEPPASAGVAFAGGRRPVPMLTSGKRRTELLAPATGAFVVERVLSALREPVGGMSVDELRQARACLLRVAEPPAPAVVAFVAERGLSALRERAVEQLASAGVVFAGGCVPVPMWMFRERVVA